MKGGLTEEEIRVIENPNLEIDEENSRRENLLFNTYGRSAILDKLPDKINWYKGSLEESDLDNLYILAIWDWFLDTGKTFRLSLIPSNLSSSHGHRVSNFPAGAADHKSKIEEMAQSMSGNFGDIVAIGSSKTGPYTIIDGTHRASLLTMSGGLIGTLVYLGVASDLSQCVWTPEWLNYKESLSELNRLVDEGHLW
jgi:hypothetical protein